MTTQEHALMIGMMAAQFEAIFSLVDVLKSRGIIDSGDLHAFSQIRPPEAQKETMERAKLIYSVLLKSVGLEAETPGAAPAR